MSENENRLRDVLKRLVEILDSACISFDEIGGDDAVEISLEFDEAYLAACEALGMDLAENPPAPRHAAPRAESTAENHPGAPDQPSFGSDQKPHPSPDTRPAAGSPRHSPGSHPAPMHP
ncbi:MAG: hypothetical protein LC772_03905 [Chloroflexi bacterium]|nr:hypothetical protein [Chloroflexota bacterium]